jgi:hypothetical protein
MNSDHELDDMKLENQYSDFDEMHNESEIEEKRSFVPYARPNTGHRKFQAPLTTRTNGNIRPKIPVNNLLDRDERLSRIQSVRNKKNNFT